MKRWKTPAMDRLPSSFRQQNRTTSGYREQYKRLPRDVQELTRKVALRFHTDPQLRSLRHHQLKDCKTGSHKPGTWSVGITMQYRALYVKDGDINIWYWIGTHAAYNKFAGRTS